MLAHGMSVTQRPLPQPAGHVVASPSAHDLFPYGLSSPIRHGMPATPPRFETPPPTVPPKPLSPHTSPFKTPRKRPLPTSPTRPLPRPGARPLPTIPLDTPRRPTSPLPPPPSMSPAVPSSPSKVGLPARVPSPRGPQPVPREAAPVPVPLLMVDGEVMTDDMMDPTTPSAPSVATSDGAVVAQHASSSSAAERDAAMPTEPPVSQGVHAMCHRCGRWIGGYMVHAMGKAWHARCFTCAHCATPLEHVSFYEHEGEPYCHLDFHELFSRRCYYCQTPIVDERFVTVDAFGEPRTYHEAHFFCANCGDPFVEQKDGNTSVTEHSRPFYVHGRHAYCEACHRPRCQACKKVVGDEHIQALRAVWHPECFVCTRCGRPCQGATFVAPDGSPCDFDCYQAWIRGTAKRSTTFLS